LQPDSIPLDFFFSLAVEKETLMALFKELEKNSLINTTAHYLSVHRVIQDATKVLIQERHLIENYAEHCVNKVLALLHIQHRLGVETEFDYYHKRFLIPHLETALSQGEKPGLSPAICQGYIDLALLYKAIGEAKKAVSYYEKILPLIITQEDDQVAEVYKGLGRAYQGSGNYDRAKIYYEKAYQIVAKHAAPNPDLAEVLNDLGMIYRDIGHQLNNNQSNAYFDQALGYLKQSVEMVKKLPAQNKNGVRYRINLGEVYRQQGKLEQAEVIISEALDIGKAEFKEEKHRLMASAYFNLGNVYLERGETNSDYYQQAKTCFEKAVMIGRDENVCGATHPLVARHTDALGVACQKLGEDVLACQHFQEALQMLEQSGRGQPQLKARIEGHLEKCNKVKPTF